MSEFSLVTAENSFLIEPDELSIPRPGLWPSEASVEYELDGRTCTEGKCMREAWFRNMGFSKDKHTDPGMAIKWDMGKSAEVFSVERWKRMGIYKANSVKFFDRALSVSGELDCVIKNPETCGLVGVEAKSFYGHYASQEICGSKRPPIPGRPKEENFLQAAIYAAKYREKLEQFRLYYIERGDGHRVEFEVGVEGDEENLRPFHRQIDGPYWNTFREERVVRKYTMNDIYARYNKLRKYLIDRETPPREFVEVWDQEKADWLYANGKTSKSKYDKFIKSKDEGDWQCAYCSFPQTCRNADRPLER